MVYYVHGIWGGLKKLQPEKRSCTHYYVHDLLLL
nr:MAG TPA: hypothetical protein [Caudoviricetes sp.]DAZ13018.1 MAG TPA: hypothetical protein [Caudoviricetes sp.]